MWAGLGYYRRARFLLEVNTLWNSMFDTVFSDDSFIWVLRSNDFFDSFSGSKDGCCREGGVS